MDHQESPLPLTAHHEQPVFEGGSLLDFNVGYELVGTICVGRWLVKREDVTVDGGIQGLYLFMCSGPHISYGFVSCRSM